MATVQQEDKPKSVLTREAIMAVGFILVLGYIIFKVGAAGAKAEIKVPN